VETQLPRDDTLSEISKSIWGGLGCPVVEVVVPSLDSSILTKLTALASYESQSTSQHFGYHGGLATKVYLRIRLRGKRGYDISSVPMKKLKKAGNCRKKRWELREDGWLVLEAF
jgi:hypothetical protein